MSVDAGAAMEKVRAAGLLRTQGLIGGKWVDAYDGKTIEVFFALVTRPHSASQAGIAPVALASLSLLWCGDLSKKIY